FKFRPTRLRLGADPELATHRAYGLPKPAPTPELMKTLESTRINPTGELPEPQPVSEAAMAIAKLDGYTENQTDQADMERQWPQLKGQFLIDRDGIVRWANIECATEGLAGVGKFPSEEEILTAARSLPRS
ncbi:MAG: redoxin domain-containing protein, partial [Candidatus Rokuibacteriota bacterium]